MLVLNSIRMKAREIKSSFFFLSTIHRNIEKARQFRNLEDVLGGYR